MVVAPREGCLVISSRDGEQQQQQAEAAAAAGGSSSSSRWKQQQQQKRPTICSEFWLEQAPLCKYICAGGHVLEIPGRCVS